MSALKIGSLFSGIGALDHAVEQVFAAEVVWHIEYDSAPSKVLSFHKPNIPNFGDVTKINFASLPKVDGLAGGYPCQPFSTIGKRKGKNDERHLWPYFLTAIRELRPRFAVLENVAGHLSLGFDTVLRDLAEIGWAAEWISLPASSAGAPHQRERVFILAHPEDEQGWLGNRADLPSWRSQGERRSTTRASATANPDNFGSNGRWGSRHGGIEPAYPRVPDAIWGRHLTAINHWESVTGRHAPWPGHPGGGVTTEFTEWQMGWPYRLVTDPAIGLSRQDQAHIIGNGVVPQQAALALRVLLERITA